MIEYGFRERLAFSEGIEIGGDALLQIAKIVPNAKDIIRASESDDRNGTDYWITRSHGLPPVSIDVKHRSFCPIERFGSDDACIETTSVYSGGITKPFNDSQRKKIGWTLNYSKRTDYVAYTWPSGDGVRYWVVPFLPLCAVSRAKWREWSTDYPERVAKNAGYITLSIYPPRSVIAKAMRSLMYGLAK